MLDAFIDCTEAPAHGPWDYLGGLLVCQEAGAVVADRYGDDLVVLEHGARRSPDCRRHTRAVGALHKKSE